MKKALSIATATALMLSLAACGSSAASSSAAPAADSTASSTAESSSAAESTGDKKDLTFGYIAYDMSDIWNEYSAKAFEYAAEQNGVKTVVLDSKNSLAVVKLLLDVRDQIGCPVVTITHNAEMAKVADRVFYMKDGQIIRVEKNEHPLKAEELQW